MSDSVRDTDNYENSTRREYLRTAALGGTVVAALATSDMEPTSNMEPASDTEFMSEPEYTAISQSDYKEIVENANVAKDSSTEGIRLDGVYLNYIERGNVSEERSGILDPLLNYSNDGEDALIYRIEDSPDNSSDNKIDDGYLSISDIAGEDDIGEISREDAKFERPVSIEGCIKATEEYGDDGYAFQIDNIYAL